jgi:hypothetical protein
LLRGSAPDAGNGDGLVSASRREPPKRTGRDQTSRRPLTADRTEVALYIGRLAAEMVELARLAEFRTLAYLADMVRMEADQQARAGRRRGGSVKG